MMIANKLFLMISTFKTCFKMFFWIMILSMMLLYACNGSVTTQDRVEDERLKQYLINANIAANQAEEEQINDFIERHRWNMQKSGSGLRYLIYKQGKGQLAEEGRMAMINYTLQLITGDIVYSSAEGGPMNFLIGKGEVESGLEEAILLMRVGDKAKIIIPSHLGFGLAGDDHKIPPKSTLIYDIELLEIK